MSQFMPESDQAAARTPERGPESYLSPDERKFIQRYLSFPEDLPPKFKSWLIDFMAVNIPQIPISQVTGYTQTYRVLDRNFSEVDATNTVAETTLYSFQVPNGVMGTDRRLRLTLQGDWMFNRVLNENVTIRVKFGGTTIISDSWNPGGNQISADRFAWQFALDISNRGATNSQISSLVIDSNSLSGPPAAPASGYGDLARAQNGIAGSTSAIETSNAQTLAVTIQWGVASGLTSWRKRYASLELV